MSMNVGSIVMTGAGTEVNATLNVEPWSRWNCPCSTAPTRAWIWWESRTMELTWLSSASSRGEDVNEELRSPKETSLLSRESRRLRVLERPEDGSWTSVESDDRLVVTVSMRPSRRED